jgi:hypothetical protein
MSLVKCKECGNQVSDRAKNCPNCGAKVKRIGLFSKILIGLVAFYLIGQFLGNTGSSSSQGESKNLVSASSEPKSVWRYSSQKDEMTGKDMQFAETYSTNTQDLHWPYGSNVRGELTIRKHPRYGKSVLITLTKGQILCRSYENCTIMVRFDEGKPERYAAIGPADGSSDQVFIRNYDKFVANLRKSETVRIELPLYQDGNRAWNFNVSGFDWK